MSVIEYLLWAALLIATGACVAIYASQPHLRARIRVALATIGGLALGLIMARFTRTKPPPPSTSDETPPNTPTAQEPPHRTASSDAPTPRPHERDHVAPPSDRTPRADVPLADADADDIARYIERARRDGVL